MRTLDSIDRTISKVGRILGRSATVSRLPTFRKGKTVYRNNVGKTVAVGVGKDTVTATNQS